MYGGRDRDNRDREHRDFRDRGPRDRDHGGGGYGNRDAQLFEYLAQIVKQFVDKPDDVQITEQHTPMGLLIQIKVDAEDVGKVIGKEGRIINAIRQILKAAGGKTTRRFKIDLVS
ncbi:KH domain-containing protein [bacterium]|nr:KH domain-containing protein [bacterium]